MAGVDSMQIEGRKLSSEVRRGLPNLNLRSMSRRNEPATPQISPQHSHNPHDTTHFPSGENLTSRTGSLKLK